MSTYFTLAAAVLIGATAYFAVQWFTARLSLSQLNLIERANADIEYYREVEAARIGKTRRQRAHAAAKEFAAKRGWAGDLTPALIMWMALYLACSMALRVAGFSITITLLIALPASLAVIQVLAARAKGKRRAKFNRQLLQALRLLASQVEAGNGLNRAFNSILPNLPDPLHGEFATMLAKVNPGAISLVEGMREVAERYPSRAIVLLTAALEVDERGGSQIAPVLRQAAEILQRDFEVHEEAAAEMAQTRFEFLFIIAIMGLISFFMVTQGSTGDAYRTPLGVMVLTGCIGWFGLGTWLATRVLNRIQP